MCTTEPHTYIPRNNNLSDFDSEFDDIFADLVLEGVDFLVREGSVHRPIGDPVALGGSVGLGVGEFVRELDFFHQIPGDSAGHFEKVVLDIIFGKPKGDIFKDDIML